jgi:putative pyrroloquinoline-quinone binding quinoprotein
MRTEAVRLALTRLTPCCLLIVLGACGDESDPADAVTPDPTTIVAAVESTPSASSTATPTTAAAALTTTVAGPSSTLGVPPLPGPPAPPIGDDVPIVTEPAPDEMCDQGSVPQAAAYDFDDGTFRWVSCTDELAWRTVRAVTDDAVYIETGNPQELTALDPASGDVLSEAPPPPPKDDPGDPAVIEVDGVRVSGEQITRVWVTDANGVEQWTRPGGWVYGDVWAIDDGAVFAVENSSDLVAYDLQTGNVRWAHRGDPYAEGLWPWHAEGQRLYSMWGNLQVRSTVDGALIWATQYPWEGEPAGSVRMSGVGIHGESVFIAFASETSGGD